MLLLSIFDLVSVLYSLPALSRKRNTSEMERIFVTGAAGFIGSNLVDHLLASGCEVVGWDNFSTGQHRFVEAASARYRLIEGDNLDLDQLTRAMAGCDTVFHLAANADVRFGLEHPSKDLNQNTIATFNVLEAMRANGIARIAFSSTGSVYGEATVIPTPEDAPFPVQTSLYAASKVAGEGMIQAYCEGFGFEGYIFRFVSILGERYTHGHVFDFYKQLRDHPNRLKSAGRWTSAKVLSLRERLFESDVASDEPRDRRKSQASLRGLQSRSRRVLRGARFDFLDLWPSRTAAGAGIHWRRKRVGGR